MEQLHTSFKTFFCSKINLFLNSIFLELSEFPYLCLRVGSGGSVVRKRGCEELCHLEIYKTAKVIGIFS